MYLPYDKVIGDVIWVRQDCRVNKKHIIPGKVRIQFADNKKWRLTLPLSMVKGEPVKDGQLRVYFDKHGNPEKAEVPKRPHKVCRNFEWTSHNFHEVTLQCTSCVKTKTRTMTPAERQVMYGGDIEKDGAEGLLSPKGKSVHTVWHDFRKEFLDEQDRFLTSGYDLILAIEKWARKYPEDVKEAYVDDSHFMGSRIFFIEHKIKEYYMGTTAVYAGQCGDAVCFFMYPGHLHTVMTALKEIRREARPIERLQAKLSKEKSAKLKVLFKNG